jgi:hypothetical protein
MSFGARPPTLQRVDETYRMLGREHELDLAREARNRGLAAAVGADRTSGARVEPKRRRWAEGPTWVRRVPLRLAALFR